MTLTFSHLHLSLLLANPLALLLFGLIVFLAAYVRATIGFGSGLIMVGLLSLMFPVKLVVPLVLLLDVVGSILLGGYDFKQIRWPELSWLLPGSLIGLALGAWLLDVTPAQHLTLFLGVFLGAYVVYAVLVNPEKLPRATRKWGLPLGTFGGIVGSLYGGGGPPIVAYLQMRKLEKRAFRATFQGVALADNAIRIIMYVSIGLLMWSQVWVALVFAPVMALGLWFGNRLHFRISEKTFLRATLVLLAIIALKYIVASFI